ncbi:serine/threonine protein kinase [Actinoallomurus sp. NBC_01490]|uniref:serine/threonine-protein kinase n=1 Tax=Actinoallomurus sp. NBC_01490 TaxID=2903557 RepID=UPI002E36277B|nr:serine/threonine-protein kinase [Actinoallomurus sp. NBC_01490]
MPEDLQPGDPRRLGGYRLLSRLGRGGMGTVYLGENDDGGQAAIKVINQELASDTAFAERFRQEVRAARRVRRFCTAPVLDAEIDRPPYYVVTEFITGPTLQDAVESEGPLRGSDLEGLAVGMATALSAIHDAGLVHRDLKPTNVLLSSFGPRVIDFGIARALDSRTAVTRTGQLVGTPAYLAPELITGGEVTPVADVFSWGCVLAFAGTGRDPFNGRTLPEILHRVVYEPPDLDGLDPSLRGIVEASLAKDPKARPGVPELLTRLTGHSPDTPDPSTHPPDPSTNPPGPSTSGRQQSPTITMHGQPVVRPHRMPHVPFPPPPPPPPPRPRKRFPCLVIGLLAIVAVPAVVIVAVTMLVPDSGSSADRSSSRKSGATASPGTSGRGRGDVPAKFLGKWHGSVDQEDSLNSPYPVVLTLTQGRVGTVVGRSSYPTLRCGGELKLTKASTGRLMVEEHITTGQANCVDDTVITLRYRTGRRVDYSFSDPTGHGLLTH